jgi:hypothetical protein
MRRANAKIRDEMIEYSGGCRRDVRRGRCHGLKIVPGGMMDAGAAAAPLFQLSSSKAGPTFKANLWTRGPYPPVDHGSGLTSPLIVKNDN